MTDSKLTGRRRYRANWRHQLILQVEVKSSNYDHQLQGYYLASTYWRDARVEDLMKIEAVHRPHPVVETT